MKKKTMIALALTALLLIAVITVAAQSAPTGSSYVEWETTELTTVWSTETTEENTSEALADLTDEATEPDEAVETEEPAVVTPLITADKSPAKTTITDTVVAAGSSSTMSAQPSAVTPAAAIAPVVPTPATAAQTTTTTRYVPPQTAVATTSSNTVLYTKGNYEWAGTTAASTTTTTQYIPPTTTSTRPPTTTTTTWLPTTTTTTQAPITPAGPDYEAMGQATYQDEAIRALNALRAERGLPPMTVNVTLMANSLAHAQMMAAAGREFHTTVNMPGCESVARIPYNFPAKLLGETLGKHTPQFLTDSRSSVGIAVVRQGNYLYAVLQGS